MWRVVEQKLAAERELLAKTEDDALKAQFLDMARAKLLSPEEVMVATYLMYGARKFFAGMLMHKRGIERRP